MRSSVSKAGVFVFLCGVIGPAQSPLGTVTGVAVDPAGAVVGEAGVELESLDTGIKRTTRTNSSGAYVFPNLPPGNYRLSASAPGFRPFQAGPFKLEAYRTVRVDLTFQLAGPVTEVTVVEAIATAVTVESPSLSARLSTRQVQELPTNLRSVFNNAGDSGLIFQMMPLTVPGVFQVGAGAAWVTPGTPAGGLRVKVDGIETNFGNFGTPDPVAQPSLESVAEFTANVLANRAEFAGMGMITSVTRSGTNDLQASLFWYLRNSALDARNPFLTERPFQNIHNFGASAAGPLRKDRTFFWLSWDETRGSRAYSFVANVPTLAQRRGDFSGAPALRNPFGNANPYGPNNQILPQFLSPQALRAQEKFFPLPNYGPPDLTAGNYRASFNGPETHRILEARADHNWSSGHSGFLRYQFKNSDYQIPGARSPLPPTSVGTSQNNRNVHFLTLGDIAALRPTLVNEARAGLVTLASSSSIEVTGDRTLAELGISGLPPRGNVGGIPNISITGYSAVTQRLLNPVIDGRFQLSDNLTWVRGAHTVKFGGEWVQWFVNRWFPVSPATYGNFTFTNRFTGHPYADFLLGLPTQVTRLDPSPTQYTRWKDVAWFAQDDWKLSRTLTLSYGLRYELNSAASLREENIYTFDPAGGAVVVPSERSLRLLSPYLPPTVRVLTAHQAGFPRNLRRTDRNNLAPRFGFSWQPSPAAHTVIRGGAGIYYTPFSGAVTGALASGPYAISTTAINQISGGVPLFTFAQPFAAPGQAGSLNLTAISPELSNPRVLQYSLSIERELARDLGVRLSYLGVKGTQLAYRRNINQPWPSEQPFSPTRRPYPLYATLDYADNGANSLYSGLQVQLQRRFSRGLFLVSAWTWSKALSEVDDTGNAELQTMIENAYDRRRDRADLYAVARHQWMNQVLYELPWARRHRWLGGWQLNALVNLASGNFLNPLWSGADTTGTGITSARPDLVRPISYPQRRNRWYEPAAFARPPQGRFGSAARNSIVGPGYVIANLGLMKTFRTERYGSLQLGASFQNLFNHPNLGEPNLTVNSSVAGSITSTHVFPAAGAARTGQLSLRWNY